MVGRFTLTFLNACVLLSLAFPVQAGAGWEYSGPLGPEEWHIQFPNCGGRMQSPIDIKTNKVLFDPSLQVFDLRQYSACQGCSMTLENVAGHTVEVKYGGQQKVIEGGSLPDIYVLDQFHFHWGSVDEEGSEHFLDGQRAPMEMHIVHHMEKYNKTVAASKPYGLAVLAFFFQIGDHNPGFDFLLPYFTNVTHRGNKIAIPAFAVADLLPSNTSTYYRYFGSLTTPPCYESVIWTIFTEKISVSEQQLNIFRGLRTLKAGQSRETAISDDFRPLQPLHERMVTSNDRSVLRRVVYDVIDRLEKDLEYLKATCGTGGTTSLVPLTWAILLNVLLILRVLY